MLHQDPIRPHLKLSCPCGGDVRVDPLSQDRSLHCPKCGLPIHFVVSVDPQDRRRSKVSLVVPRTAVRAEGESLGMRPSKAPSEAPKTVRAKTVAAVRVPPPPQAPPAPRPSGRTVKGVRGQCVCGESFPVDESDLAGMQSCPGCGVRYHTVIKLEKGTRKKVVMLVPVKVTSQPDARSRMLPKPAAAPRKTVRVPRASTPGAPSVACSCGAPLLVRRRELAEGMTCPSCRRVLAFSETRDPQTLAPLIRLREEPR